MIKTFEEAYDYFCFCAMMREDLPDGQWEELQDIREELKADYGKVKEWPSKAKEYFTDAVRECMLAW